jgi:hypothetical protein
MKKYIKIIWILSLIILGYTTNEITIQTLDNNLLEGMYPPGSDSISIPIFNTMISLVFLVIYIYLLQFFLMIKYFKTNNSILVKSIIVMILYFIAYYIIYRWNVYWLLAGSIHSNILIGWFCLLLWIFITSFISFNTLIKSNWKSILYILVLFILSVLLYKFRILP